VTLYLLDTDVVSKFAGVYNPLLDVWAIEHDPARSPPAS
jgi:hypothetical protein